VLNVISNSVSDAEPVFEKIVESCERIFATSRIGLNLIGPDGLVHAGAYGKFPGAEKLRRENFPHPVPGSATGAAISAGRPIQYPDALDSDVPQYGRRAAKIVGFRAFVMAPLLSEGRGLGAIFVGRETIGSFSDKEIALLKTFAAQAVIAIENTRLLNELRESLDRQTATADVLRIISSSHGELHPVFQAMLENATRLCGADWIDYYSSVSGPGPRLGVVVLIVSYSVTRTTPGTGSSITSMIVFSMTGTPCLGAFLGAIFATVFGGRFFGVARFAAFVRAGLTRAFPRFEVFLLAIRFFALAMAVPIASFADIAKPVLATTRVLLRHESDPGREVPS
jgi:hypothetical protein